MTEACPLPTPAERQFIEIHAQIQDAMIRKVYAALEEATAQARAAVAASGLETEPPPAGYFASVIHQSMYCTLCDADPETFAGGKPNIAMAIIKNSQNIARHYWGASIEQNPRS